MTLQAVALWSSLNLNGKEVKVNAVMSLPRLGWNDAWGCAHDALAPFGIPISRFFGVFWGQCMQRALSDAVENGVDWILTIDYDSVFTTAHVDTLLSVFADNPDMDAIAPLQVKRASDTPLMYRKNSTEITFGKTRPFRVDTAHFGLTLLRVDSLRRMPKPWFKAEPGKDGEWGEGRTDEDIYFWEKWYDCGFSTYIHPAVKIGHLEIMVSEFDEDFNVIHTNVSKWRERELGSGNQGVQLRAQPLQDGPSSEPFSRNGSAVGKAGFSRVS